MAEKDEIGKLPGGYRFLRVVLIAGGIGFCVLGAFYILGGQWAPGVFALVVGVLELAALPLFSKLLQTTRKN